MNFKSKVTPKRREKNQERKDEASVMVANFINDEESEGKAKMIG